MWPEPTPYSVMLQSKRKVESTNFTSLPELYPQNNLKNIILPLRVFVLFLWNLGSKHFSKSSLYVSDKLVLVIITIPFPCLGDDSCISKPIRYEPETRNQPPSPVLN